MVKLRENESTESLIKRFKKQVDDDGILKEWKNRQYFEKPSSKRHHIKQKAKRKFENILREEREKEKQRKGR